jgi:cob(I)alamin adenosyltransferase
MPEFNILRKTGDTGKTDLFSGEAISKSSLRLECLGHLDELNCVLGLARFYVAKSLKNDILHIQKNLFLVGSELATSPLKLSTLSNRIDLFFLDQFEKKVNAFYKKTKLPKGFLISGDHQAQSYLHLARAVCRRLERSLVRLFEKKQLKNKYILAFINRLSVYLFLMAASQTSSKS